MSRDAVLTTRPTRAARRPLRFVPRRRHRPDSGARDAVRLCGDPADSRAVGQHEPLQPEERRLPRCSSRVSSRQSWQAISSRTRSRCRSACHSAGRQTDAVPPMLSAALAKVGADGNPAYPRGVEKLNDTADPVALMRNALTGQTDQNGGDRPRGSSRQSPVAAWRIPDGKELGRQRKRAC